MAKQKIVITGGNGFIGSYLSKAFELKGFEVVTIGRSSCTVEWTDTLAIAAALDGAVAVINLAGKSVNCRYTVPAKQEIFRSRIETTQAIAAAISRCHIAPEVWINASTATIYRDARDRQMTENKGELGTGFSVEVAQQWEKAFFDADTPFTRKVALRMAIVLHPKGGALKEYLKITTLGFGGKQGDGKQRFSWIAIEDLFEAICFILGHKAIKGPINCSAPESELNAALMQKLRALLHQKIALPTPKPLLELGAFLLGTETELLLKSRWVYPEKLIDSGFKFKYPTLDTYLRSIQHLFIHP